MRKRSPFQELLLVAENLAEDRLVLLLLALLLILLASLIPLTLLERGQLHLQDLQLEKGSYPLLE